MTRGELRPGMRLPSERALAARLSVSRVTVVRALARLRHEGLVHTRHGSGTFVATSDRLIDTVAARQDRAGPAAVAGADALDLRWATTAGPADLADVVHAAVRDALPAALRGDGATSGSLGGLTGLLAGYLTGSGLPTLPGQLTLTSGAMTGLGLVVDVSCPSTAGVSAAGRPAPPARPAGPPAGTPATWPACSGPAHPARSTSSPTAITRPAPPCRPRPGPPPPAPQPRAGWS
jgi:DNA-binding transcriptional MocR family regulator